MRRLSTIIAAGVAGLALVAAGPQPATAAEQELVVNSVTLLDTGFSDMVKTDRIFLSGGAGHDTIQIADLDGVIVGTIPGQAGAIGLTLSSDGGTVYAALSRADAISVIDTATGTATGTERGRLPLGTGTCPYDVALAGDKLWFSYGCPGTPRRAASLRIAEVGYRCRGPIWHHADGSLAEWQPQSAFPPSTSPNPWGRALARGFGPSVGHVADPRGAEEVPTTGLPPILFYSCGISPTGAPCPGWIDVLDAAFVAR